MHQWKSCFLAHERLAIIDPASGDQPLYNEDKSIVVAVNGESPARQAAAVLEGPRAGTVWRIRLRQQLR